MKNPIDLHIGQRVRHRRWLQGMTQQQLAREIGIRFQQVQKYESAANRISAARLWEVARALDTVITFFFDGLDDPSHGLGNDGSSDVTLHQKETLDLVRAYYAMDERPRQRLLELIKAISNQGSHSDKVGVQIAY